MIRWEPDTCYCVLIVQDDFSALVSIEQRCKLHENIEDGKLLKIVHKSNMEKDIRLGDNPTEGEVLANDKVKLKEKTKTKL